MDTIKQIPVWVVALILVCGTVAAAGLWLLRMDAPISYQEPFIVKHSDELLYDQWETIDRFPYRAQRGPIDLTYRTFHEYISVSYEGRRSVNITATFVPEVSGVMEPYHVGFVLLEGIVDPENVTWNGNTAINGEQQGEIRWGFHETNIILGSREVKNYTVINVLSNSAPLYVCTRGVSISWHFARSEVDPAVMDDIPGIPRDRVFNIAPITLLIALLLTAIVGYMMFKDIEEVE